MKIIYQGKSVEIKDGANGFDAAKELDAANKSKDVALKAGSEMKDLRDPLKEGEEISFVNEDSPEAFELLNHSTSHLMAQAIIHLYPNAKFGFGPAIEEGYYYDVDFGDQVITEADFAKIEEEMKKLSKENIPFVRKEVSAEEAKKIFAANPYKQELIKEHENELISIYQQGDFTDFCRGPHLPSTGYIKHFKLSEKEYELIRDLPEKSRRFLIKQGSNSVVAELDLRGFDDELAVLSGNTATSLLAEQLVAQLGEDPAIWLPEFHKIRRERIAA